MSGWRFLRAVSISASLAALALPQALFAQSAPPPAAGSGDTVAKAVQDAEAAPGIPTALVDAILAGDADAYSRMRDYLTAGGKRPEEVTRRATALIARIGERKSALGTDALLQVIDRIASNAINLVSGSQVLRVGIDNNFVPRRAIVAWDFGPPDGAVAPGFQRVLPGDPRLGGAALDGLRRPADSSLLSDGIKGVERIETDLPDGDYRVILLTQNLGDRALMANPFGTEVIVNGSAQPVAQPSPDQWVRDALFSNRGLRAINAQATPADTPGAAGSRGFLSGALNAVDKQVFERQQGGAIIIPATARGGKLIIELRGFRGARSYLTGLMIEPANEISDLILSREAADSIIPPELRLALEENILAAAASVLADIDPAAGDPELVELPEPILDPEENASTST